MPSKHQRKGSCTSVTMRNETARTEFKSVLRIRPLLKKERDDLVVLEPIDTSTVALHPLLENVSTAATTRGVDLVSPHSAVSQDTVQTGQDVEFHFDRVLSTDANQEKVYFSTGQPMAMASMAALKIPDNDIHSKRQKTHLVICMGLAASGKTFIGTGNHQYLNKRKNDSDGLVPRILDSLFSQSKHTVISNNNNKKVSFAVKMTILQVNQNKSNPADCQLFDLLQPASKRAASLTTESLGSGLGTIASTFLNSMDLSTNSSSSSGSGSKNYSELHDPVNVQQDPVSSECILVNVTAKRCSTSEYARELLQKAMSHSRKMTNKKYQCHMWIEMQPLLISSRSGRTISEGERIAVLDMASCDTGSSKQRAARLRDSLPNRADAHTSVMHCLKAIQCNEDITSSSTLRQAKSYAHYEEDEDVYSLDNGNSNMEHRRSLRKVPFLQHKVTMLLQPMFSPNNTDKTIVTLLVAASPSNRDHAAKKAILSEVVTLHRPPPNSGASTGINSSKTSTLSKKDRHSNKSERKKNYKWNGSDTDDKGREGGSSGNKSRAAAFFVKPVDVEPHKPSFEHLSIERASSMTYSDSTLEDDVILGALPPPVAPGFKHHLKGEDLNQRRHKFSPQASAPFEDLQEKAVPAPPSVAIVDFPGVGMPPSSPKAVVPKATTAATASVSVEEDGFENAQNLAAVHKELATDNVDEEEDSASAPKFSYMKTINKVVHASKKKGRKVMEKMTVTTFSSGSSGHASSEDTDSKLLQRLAELQKQNSNLSGQNEALREKNRQLQERLDMLDSGKPRSLSKDVNEKVTKENTDCEVENDFGFRVSDIRTGDDGPSRIVTAGKPVLSNNLKYLNKKENKNREWRTSPKQTYDDPFFQLMANMTNQTNGRWDSQQETDQCHEDELCDSDDASLNDESNLVTGMEDHGRPKESFDDPLFQHMAMMNNLE